MFKAYPKTSNQPMLHVMLALILIGAGGCVSSGVLTVTQDFRLPDATRVSVIPSADPKGFLPVLENELLVAGFDVGPVESAIASADAEQSTRAGITDDQLDVSSRTSVTAGTRLPSRIGMSLTYTYSEYPAATYFTRAFIRIIDFTDQRVIASYRVDGSELRPLSMDRVIKDFVKQLQARVQ